MLVQQGLRSDQNASDASAKGRKRLDIVAVEVAAAPSDGRLLKGALKGGRGVAWLRLPVGAVREQGRAAGNVENFLEVELVPPGVDPYRSRLPQTVEQGGHGLFMAAHLPPHDKVRLRLLSGQRSACDPRLLHPKVGQDVIVGCAERSSTMSNHQQLRHGVNRPRDRSRAPLDNAAGSRPLAREHCSIDDVLVPAYI